MFFKRNKNLTVSYFAKNLSIIFGLVLIWRGVWYVLDGVDLILFKGNHVGSAIVGIIIGFIILYIPDRNLKEISNL
jgi:uncharacterized membrane protein HdeD (DUF308 family)